ncbi:MAG: hypothetical protein EOO06_00010 [Chitinophagaceae bacterium]|nr:MAG: hypothetical protein EOO06_00010 [Chitinophagaceae bacterium]
MSGAKAIIYESELRFLTKCVLDYPDLETGGDFFGFWNKDGLPVIMVATGPGEKTTRTSTSFYQDIHFLHQCGEFLHANFALEHIGSWHSHHRLGLDRPSGGDINTMKNCLNSQNIDKFFISISNIVEKDLVKIGGFLFSKSYRNLYEDTEWILLPNVSPFKEKIEQQRFFTFPHTEDGRYKLKRSNSGVSNRLIKQEKVELAPNSFFETAEGRSFLKKEYEKINSNSEFSDVELIQNEDKTIGITFNYDGKALEIRYPHDFSENNPNPVVIERNDENKILEHPIQAESYKRNPFDLLYAIKAIFGFTNRNNTKDGGEQKSQVINIPID